MVGNDKYQQQGPPRCQGPVRGGDCDLGGEQKAFAGRRMLGIDYTTVYSFTFFSHEYSIPYLKEKNHSLRFNYDFQNLATI